MKKAKNETEENGGVVSNFCDDKDNLLENSCCELDGLKIEMTKEPQKKDKEIVIKKADFMINVIKFENNNFLDTIRNKMLWGIDKRN